MNPERVNSSAESEPLITLLECKCLLLPSQNEQKKTESFLYVKHPDLRKHVRNVAECVVRLYGSSLFNHVCGRCGSCCRGRAVRATSGECSAIASYIGYSDDRFRSECTESATTWQQGDANLKMRDGACIFLEKSVTSFWCCSIYPVRPAGCAELQSGLQCCRKEEAELIAHLHSISFKGDLLTIDTRRSQKIEVRADDTMLIAELEAVKTILLTLRKDPPDSDIGRLWLALLSLRELEELYYRDGVNGTVVKKLDALVDDLTSCERVSEASENSLALLHSRIERLVAMVDKDINGMQQPEGPDDRRILTMRLMPDTAIVIASQSGSASDHILPYSCHAELLSLVRELVHFIAGIPDPVVMEAMWHLNSQCFLCGECCRIFKVEITPYDIKCIADHLQISEKDMWNDYLYPGIFSWNRGNGILKKKADTGADYTGGSSDCIFLDSYKNDRHLCSVYEARPEVCRGFSSDSLRCREKSALSRQDRLAENLRYIDIAGDLLFLTTARIQAGNAKPLKVYAKRDDRLLALCRKVRETILTIIGQ